MVKNHRIWFRATKEFKEMLEQTTLRENFASVSDFIRHTLHQRIYRVDSLYKLCKVLEKDEGTKNTKLPY